MKNLQGRVAVVTGAGSGIGRATAVELARRGAGLALVDVDRAGMDETAAQIEALDRGVSRHEIDVSDRQRMAALPDEVVAAHGAVDVVVNNAGVAVAHTVANMDLEDFDWIVGINFWGVVYGTRFFLPHLLARDEAHLVNVSSVFGLIGVPGQSSYCATKFAVRGFTESLCGELHGTSVGVTTVHPGGVATAIAERARFRDTINPDITSSEEVARRFEEVARTTPEKAGRLIADAIQRNRPRLRIGADARFLDRLQRLAPVRYLTPVNWVMRR